MANLFNKKSELPTKQEFAGNLRIIGLVLAFVATEITTISVLAKAIAQPQGIAVYDPEKIVREMDLFLILADVNLIGAHILVSIDSLGLLNWITKE